MWFALLSAAVSVAVAGEATFDLRVEQSALGAPLHDGEVAMPYSGSFDAEVDGKSWRLKVEIVERMGAAEVETELYRLKGKKQKEKLKGEARIRVDPDTPHQSHGAGIQHPGGDSAWLIAGAWARTLTPAPLPEATPDDWTTSRHALVWDDAWLYKHPRSSADREQDRELPGGRVDPSAELSPFRVVIDWGSSHYEAETVPSELAPHCYEGAPPSRAYPFQHYVRVEDTAPVLTRPHAVAYDDGTGIALAAGVAVVETDQAGIYAISVGGFAFELAIPEDAVGATYRPSPHFPVSNEGAALDPAEVLGQTGAGPIRYTGAEPVVIQGREGVREALITVRTPCADIRMRVD